ncbi:MAG: AbrB family transcriptional regulator [Anaerorhabdus sp.]
MSFCLIFLVGYIGYSIAKKIHLPAPAMLGSLIFVTIFNMFFDSFTLPSLIKIFTQGISGAFIGSQIKNEDLKSFKLLYKPIILLLTLFTINTFVTGFIIFSNSNLSLITSLLCCVPGGITDISLISMDFGADSTIVAIMHLIRLIFVLTIFPFVIKFINRDNISIGTYRNNESKSLNNKSSIFSKNSAFTLFIALTSSILGYFSDIPAATLIFSMISVAFFNIKTNLISMNKELKTFAQVGAGALVGSSANSSIIFQMDNLINPILIMLLSYVIVNAVFTIICTKLDWLDQKSAMFTSCPAGASDMALIASDLGGDLKKIAIIQAIRLMYAVSVIPQFILIYLSI